MVSNRNNNVFDYQFHIAILQRAGYFHVGRQNDKTGIRLTSLCRNITDKNDIVLNSIIEDEIIKIDFKAKKEELQEIILSEDRIAETCYDIFARLKSHKKPT